MLLINRRCLKVLFLIIRLSDYNIILGRKQALYLEVLINYKNHSLKQLVYYLTKKHYSKVIATLKAVLLLAKRPSKLNKQYQKDADYYNIIIILNNQRPRILKRDKSSSNLKEPSIAPKIPPSILQPKVPIATINIIQISIAIFYINLRRKKNVLFQVLLYNIKHKIQYRAEAELLISPNNQQTGETELKQLQQVLLPKLKEYTNVFSKEASNILLLRQFYNYKIQIDGLKGVESLGYSALYYQSIEELLQIKKFLKKNLQKGFIKASQALYSLLILFIRKPNKGLQFCINFYVTSI